MKIVPFLYKISKLINSVLIIVCVLLFIIMLVVIGGQVVARYIFDTGLFWAEALSRILMVWMSLLGAAILVYEKGHLSIDFLIEKLKFNKQIKVFHLIISVLFIYVLIFYGFKQALLGLNVVLPSLGVSRFWAYLAIPVGGTFMMIQSIILWIEHFTNKDIPTNKNVNRDFPV